jgi:hypothetical protein
VTASGSGRIKLGIRQRPAPFTAAPAAPAASPRIAIVAALVGMALVWGRRTHRGRRVGARHSGSGRFGRRNCRRAIGNDGRGQRRSFRSGGHGLPRTVQLQDLFLHAGDDLVVLVVVFEEIGDVQEGIALQAYVDKCRLHARQHPRDSTFMDTARQRVFILPLVENFNYLIVFDHRHSCFVAIRRDH